MNNCNSCVSDNSFSMMNNGLQQPMPQVRTLPSNSFTQNMTNASNNTNNIQNAPMNNGNGINTTKEAVEKAVIDAVSKTNNGEVKTHKKALVNVENELSKDIKIGKELTVHAILSALTLIVALGWNEAIKYYISRHIKFYQGSQHSLLFYALIVTLLLVLYARFFKDTLTKQSSIPFVKFGH